MDEEKKPESAEAPSAEQQIPTQPAEPIRTDEVPAEVQKEPEQIAQPTQVFVPKTVAGGEAKPSRWQKIKNFLIECRRVLRVTKKPDSVEFKTIVKISGIGIVAIGLIGFLVHFIKELVF
ncbi:MAG: protein translocase SEC61 complex subunit gamma [Candidatus Woesearchaeota archaeon]